MREVEDFHPLVAKWLIEHNYSYIHEFKIPKGGRADFLATSANGKRFVIECKVNSGLRSSIRQLQDYTEQLGDGVGKVLAMPEVNITNKTRSQCSQYGVELIEIKTTPDDIQFMKICNQANERLQIAINIWFLFIVELRRSHPVPTKIIEDAVENYVHAVMTYFINSGKGFDEGYSYIIRVLFKVFRGRASYKDIEAAFSDLLALYDPRNRMLDEFEAVESRQFINALRNTIIGAPQNLFAQATDKLYLGLWERTTAQLRGELKLNEKQTPRDSFGEYALIYTRLAEMVATNKLDKLEVVTLSMALDIVWAVATLIHEQATATAHALGMDLVTERRLLPD